METLSINYSGCTTFESGPWTGSNLCFAFSCAESVDGSRECQCDSAAFDDEACAQCDFGDVGGGGIPKVDCGNVDGPNTVDMEACVTDLVDPVLVAPPAASPVDAPTAGDAVDGAPVAAPTVVGGDDLSPPDADAGMEPPTNSAWSSAMQGTISIICFGFGFLLWI